MTSDAMKQSHTSWTVQTHTDSTWDTGLQVSLTSSGYPARMAENQAVGTMLFRDCDEHVEDGTYMVRWDGDGVLECTLNVVATRRGTGWMVSLSISSSH